VSPDYYAILGIGRGASQAQVARAFRRLAFRWHPDRNASAPELAHQQFLLVHQAYEVLSDPVRRRAFDARQVAASVVRPGGMPGDEDSSEATPGQDRRSSAKPAARRPAAPPRGGPAPPAPKPPLGRALVSRGAWLVLGGLIHAVGFLALLIVGPIAERKTKDELRHRLPAFVDVIFPLGRLAIIVGLLGLGAWNLNPERSDLHWSVAILASGGLIFAVERIVLASFWVMGRRRSRQP